MSISPGRTLEWRRGTERRASSRPAPPHCGTLLLYTGKPAWLRTSSDSSERAVREVSSPTFPNGLQSVVALNCELPLSHRAEAIVCLAWTSACGATPRYVVRREGIHTRIIVHDPPYEETNYVRSVVSKAACNAVARRMRHFSAMNWPDIVSGPDATS